MRHRFDVVEADAIPFLPLGPVRLVCWLRRRPMVTTWHEFWGYGRIDAAFLDERDGA